MTESNSARSSLIFTSVALGFTAALAALSSYAKHEIRRRGYPSWEDCRCDFKNKQVIFQVWHSSHERRGETIFSQEWGSYLSGPAPWLRRLLHHSSQVLAVLNPRGHYVERVTLSPQEAQRFAVLLHAAATSEVPVVENEQAAEDAGHLVWRREVLHVPRYFFDAYIRRLYPVHVKPERIQVAQSLPVVWDSYDDLPLTTDGSLLDTPDGTRIDYIGWNSSQISYCPARLEA
jgi:hypothetical protein